MTATERTERSRHEEWVRRRIREETEPVHDAAQMLPSRLWTSRMQLLADAKKSTTDVTNDGADAAIQRLEERGDIVYWHGLLTLATEEYLEAIIESECHTSAPRRILIGQCNRLRNRESTEIVTDGGVRSGGTLSESMSAGDLRIAIAAELGLDIRERVNNTGNSRAAVVFKKKTLVSIAFRIPDTRGDARDLRDLNVPELREYIALNLGTAAPSGHFTWTHLKAIWQGLEGSA